MMFFASFQCCNESPSDDDDDGPSTLSIQVPEGESQRKYDNTFAEAVLESSKKHILQDSFSRIKVRSMIWEDANFKLKRFDADRSWCKSLRVQFLCEAAVDEGGPKREFTSLVHKFVQDQSFLPATWGKDTSPTVSVLWKRRNTSYMGNFVHGLYYRDVLHHPSLLDQL